MFNKHTTLKTLMTVFAASAIMSVTTSSFAADDSETLARMEALSYAPKTNFNEDRFSQFDLETEEYAEHELNDSWLGMPAYLSDGTLIGYIEDAYLDDEGYAEEIIVGLNNDEGIVEIQGKFASIDDEKVQFELTQTQIASLVASNQLASLKQ